MFPSVQLVSVYRLFNNEYEMMYLFKGCVKQKVIYRRQLIYQYSTTMTTTIEENEFIDDDINEDQPNTLTSDITEKTAWTYNNTLALIQSIASYMDDFNNPKKRKHIFQNVSNDLISLNYSFTEAQCANKYKSLCRSYKAAKDNINKTGRAPSRFFFFTEMDELLGKKPSISCSHAIESSTSKIEGDMALSSKRSCTDDSENNEENVPPPKKRRINEKIKRYDKLVEIEYEKLNLEKRRIALLERIFEKLA